MNVDGAGIQSLQMEICTDSLRFQAHCLCFPLSLFTSNPVDVCFPCMDSRPHRANLQVSASKTKPYKGVCTQQCIHCNFDVYCLEFKIKNSLRWRYFNNAGINTETRTSVCRFSSLLHRERARAHPPTPP